MNEQNGAVDQEKPTPLLNGAKAEKEKKIQCLHPETSFEISK